MKKKKIKKESNSKKNWLSKQMKLYILPIIAKEREIKCEKCGSLENLELHHTKYEPVEHVSYKDLQILCGKCHRNVNQKNYSTLRTVYEYGKRFCEFNCYRFEY